MEPLFILVLADAPFTVIGCGDENDLFRDSVNLRINTRVVPAEDFFINQYPKENP